MTYLAYTGDRAFEDQDASCGESTARPCGIGGVACRVTQNSVQLLLSRLGAANRDHQAPAVGITAPTESATVAAGFAIAATATDNIAVKTVAFYIDGDLIATRTEAPYELTTDPELAEGVHTILVEATDGDDNSTTQQRDVIVAGPLDPLPLGCSAGREPPGALFALSLVGLLLIRKRRPATSAL
jgi:MYXO-CTERM domain-containing protein